MSVPGGRNDFKLGQKMPSLSMFCLLLACIKPFPKQALVFTCLQHKSIENTAGKGEIARHEQILLFPQCFLPV